MKHFAKAISLMYQIFIRRSDLWEHSDWKKTECMEKELIKELHSTFVFKVIRKIKGLCF
jgi:hypothetical protein